MKQITYLIKFLLQYNVPQFTALLHFTDHRHKVIIQLLPLMLDL